MYVIARKDGIEVYFTGCKYQFQGETYAGIDNIDNAKKYKSEKIAKRSLNSLISTCVFGDEFYVKEVK